MNIVDFHAHAFPDRLAERAIPMLEQEAGVKAALNGKIASLLASMDRAGIGRSVLASIATKPEQFDAILQWSLQTATERIVPFASVHPADPLALERIGQIADAGVRGIKLHPYYQEFAIDEERMFPLYEAMERRGLILLCHTGFDIAYPRERIADPARVARVAAAFPALRFVASHLGAWEDWGEVKRHLLGKPVYFDLSYSVDRMDRGMAREMLLAHPPERLLFGSDSPWADQAAAVAAVRSLDLGSAYQPMPISH
ncbi:MAG: Amidohydrolase [candidate division BRC1 bacterium ADurb.BinA364]|nr:MAG: Amidohydrolase [candidate division BRC1 bacterium ADurb.BinA364]